MMMIIMIMIGEPVQDQVQQPQGADGHAEGGQSDHPEGGPTENREKQISCCQREPKQHQNE